MKKFIYLLCLITSISSFSQNWITNFEDAKEQATNQNKKILLVFQGSDWCIPCIKLQKSILSTPEFKKLSEDKFILLQADFPRRKANKLSKALTDQNNELASVYNQQGYFPLVVVLDKSGKALGKMGYEKLSPENYFKKLIAIDL